MVAKKKKVVAERNRLSREQVVQMAIELTHEIGIDALSMRKLAEALHVEAMSLYNHIKNKEDLLDAMVDRVVSEMHVPDSQQEWRTEMRKAAISAHQTLMKYPWASLLLVSRPAIGPAKLAHFDAIQGCFCLAGLPPAMADQVRNVIDGHIYGFTMQKLLYPTPQGEYAKAAAQFLPMLPRDVYPHSYALVEQVAQGNYDGQHHFEFGLDLLLESISSILRAHQRKFKQ